ncbi:spore coat protein SP85-like [Penaeus japonicus]|uniref:spore coat protein SP85-like n=1 Tax=Penaeus japonicus TaxID=27405 RepID=UPI001C70E201|nr:spore coat protein SP85-like [Penaeus japonicus]
MGRRLSPSSLLLLGALVLLQGAGSESTSLTQPPTTEPPTLPPTKEPPTLPPTQPPTTEPPTLPPTQPPTKEPPTMPPTQPPTTEPATHPSTQPPKTEPPTHPPTHPSTQPPTEPATHPSTQPPKTEPPTHPSTHPSTQPPTEPATEPATHPSTQPPKTEPPTHPSTQPPTEPATEPATAQPAEVSTASADQCVPVISADGLYPHPRNCSRWLRHFAGQTVSNDCPAGLHFNPATMACDWPASSGCAAVANAPCSVSGCDGGSSDDGITLSGVCACEYCLVAHAEDCTSFYHCQADAKATFHTCSDGLVFSPEASQCVPQGQFPQCQPEVSPTCDPECQCIYPAETCSQYYQCASNSIPTKHECRQGLVYNDNSHNCDYPENVECHSRRKRSLYGLEKLPYVTEEECLHLAGKYPLKDDPSKYFLCNHGKAFVLRCPPGGVFSPMFGRCMLRK